MSRRKKKKTSGKNAGKKKKVQSSGMKKIVLQKIQQKKKLLLSPWSAQNTIPYEQMYQNGICRAAPHKYNKTIQFEDINYLLKSEEEQRTINARWRDFLSYFDPTTSLQFTFFNSEISKREIEQLVGTFRLSSEHDELAQECLRIFEEQFEQGTNGIKKAKYLTFGVEAASGKIAKARLNRMEAELTTLLKQMGVASHVLSGKERLGLLHRFFHLYDQEEWHFEWPWLEKTGLQTQDFIAPNAFQFKDGYFMVGDKYCAASQIKIEASTLDDKVLKSMLELTSSMMVSIHVRPVNRADAIMEMRHLKTELESNKIDEQKRAVQSGYDMDIMPGKLMNQVASVNRHLEILSDKSENYFYVTMLVVHTGNSLKELTENMQEARSVAQVEHCALDTLLCQQEDAMKSILPLGNNQIGIERGMSTSMLAIFCPFVTQELCQLVPDATGYGLNRLSNNVVMVNRKLLNNANGIILGEPGGGKSFAAKSEILWTILFTNDEVMICDPEGEYKPLVMQLHGQVIRISPASDTYINPLDLDLDYVEKASPLSMKVDLVLSMFELILGGKDGLSPMERNLISRCVELVYQEYLADPIPEKMPILEDVYDSLLEQEESEAHKLAVSMEMYVHGSLSVFNHRTNVDIHNRLVCFDIKDLGNRLKEIGMLTIQDQVWTRVARNKKNGISTRYYIDEMHLLLREAQTAAHTIEMWKRFRKYGGIPTGLTQNISDFYGNNGAANGNAVSTIISNSQFFLLFGQSAADRKILVRELGLSPGEEECLKDVRPGEGLMIYGGTVVPISNQYPKDSPLYQLMTTRLTDLKEEKVC